MYLRLLYYANGARYKQSGGEWVFRRWVEVSSKDLVRDMGVSRPTLYKMRDELTSAGYIRVKPGIGSGKTEYMLHMLFDGKRVSNSPTCDEKTSKNPKQGSFDLDEFYADAVRKSLGEDP